MKKNRELEPWQKEDAARLHKAFDEYKKRTGKSQLAVANEIGWNTQATLHQYIKGKIPLNWKALKKLCDMFGERYDAISPTLAEENMVYAASSPPELATEAANLTLTAPNGKTMIVPPDLVDTVDDLITAWATSTVTKRQLHAYRQMFRADAQLDELPPLPKEKPSGITKNISKLQGLIKPDDPSNSH